MRKTDIEWADMTWNPLTGCYHGCTYCYARKIAERFASKDPMAMKEAFDQEGSTMVLEEPYVYNGKFEPYPYGFMPTFHMSRLHDMERAREPKRVFVCSMADLFGDWVPEWMILAVFGSCKRTPQHKYMFLTKNPERMLEMAYNGDLPKEDNFWYGTSVPTGNEAFFSSDEHHCFISMEPLRADPGRFLGSRLPEWVIVGAETGNQIGKIVPKKSWIDHLTENLGDVPVMMKNSLVPIVGEDNMRREWPEELRI